LKKVTYLATRSSSRPRSRPSPALSGKAKALGCKAKAVDFKTKAKNFGLKAKAKAQYPW